MSYQTKFGYMCECGVGAECTEIAWQNAGRPRRTLCWKCGEDNRYRQLDLTPIHAAYDDLAATPWSTGLTLLLIVLLCVALVTGWLGRLVGAAAVIVNALPPHGGL